MLNESGQLTVPSLGQGTWHMGETPATFSAEVAALRSGIERGLTVIDTAQMYANGGAEKVVGQAIAGQREKVTVVSKVLPSNASRRGVLKACDQSRRRLGIDTIDFYLLHWASSTPLHETIDAFETLRANGAIDAWGVSNFDVSEVFDLLAITPAPACVVNQVYYSLSARGIEFDLLPLMRERQIAAMAYCPLDQGELVNHPALLPVANKLGVTPAQLALAWLLHQPDVVVIPKSGSVERVAQNAAARDIVLSDETLRELDRAFAPPTSQQPLRIV